MRHLYYLPLSRSFFAILVGIFLALIAFIEVGLLRYACLRLGVGPRAAMLLLLASLCGSYCNIPVAHLPGRQILAHQEINFYGMEYVVPVVVDWPGTVIAVNVGGALIPGSMSMYLLIRNGIWVRAGAATACVAVVCHSVARPILDLGIAVPMFVPSLIAACVALRLSRRHAAPLAYFGGSIGTLIGADLLDLGAVRGLGAPVASIGGAGTFDGIFLIGVVAVLLASLSGRARSGVAAR